MDIRFDDAEALRAKVSSEFGPWSKPIEVTQEKINRFADVTGDHQWIHIDIERAKRESPFGGPVAHGFLTLSLLPALEIESGWKVTGIATSSIMARTSYASSRPFSPGPRCMDGSASSRSSRGRK